MMHSPPALAFAIAALAALPAASDPIRFTETVSIDGLRFEVPMALALEAVTETRVAVRLDADLGAIQRNLPGLMSRHIEESCERRLSIAVSGAEAEGARIRVTGQLQAEVSVCRQDGDKTIREGMLSQTAGVDTLLEGKLVDGCVLTRVVESSVTPDGFTGALMNATGYTARLNRDLEARLDEALGAANDCIELPEELRAFGTVVTRGGFRDLGEGRIGAFIEGRMDVNARNFVRLMHVLGAKGAIGD